MRQHFLRSSYFGVIISAPTSECRLDAAESQVRFGWCQVRRAESIPLSTIFLQSLLLREPRGENKNALDCSMRQSQFDKINAALNRAEFALEALRKKAVELEHKRATSKSPEDILAVNLEAAEILQQLQKIGNAVHAGNPSPHLRLVSDTE